MNLKPYQNSRHVKLALFSMSLHIKKFGMDDLCLITILKGGVFTGSGILSILSITKNSNIVLGYLGLSSYENNTSSSRDVKVTSELDLSTDLVEGRNVWIIDDICDSGLTLYTAKRIVENLNPRTIRTAVLVDKVNSHAELEPPPDVAGFAYEGDKFLVGCGLGLGERFRGLSALYELEVENEE